MDSIDINIWSDFYEDGYTPKGKIQQTYAYVESGIEDYDSEKEILWYLKLEIEKISHTQNVELSLEFFDSAKKYPNLINILSKEEYESMMYKRWQLRLKNITHKVLDHIVKEINKNEMLCDDRVINVYSES